MARKKSGSFALILYAVGGYLLYENWPAVSAWFGSMVAATPAPAAAVPASAGTVVSTAAPASAAPASAAPVTPPVAPASAGTIVSTTPPAIQVQPMPEFMVWRADQANPLVRVSLVKESIAQPADAAQTTAA